MSGQRREEKRLDDLRQRIAARRREQGAGHGGEGERARASAYHLMLRLLADMGVALTAGVLLGYGVDHYAGTRPWGMLAGALLGLAAGVRNVLHTADSVSRGRRAGAGGDASDENSAANS